MRSCEKVFDIGDDETAPTLADIEAARAPARRHRARHAGVRLGDVLAAGGPAGAPEGREPAAHGLVQDPRRRQHDRHARRRGARRRRRRGERRQPRPGGRVGGARGRRSRATIFMPQDAPMAKVDATRNYGAQVELVGAALRRRARRGAASASSETGRDLRPRVRGRARDRRPGHDRARARRAAARARDGRRSRSAAAGSRPGSRSRCARCGPRCGSSASRPRLRPRRRHRARYTIADGIAVKQPGDADLGDPRRPARRRRRRSPTTRSATRSCSCWSGRSSSSRGPARRRSPRCSRARCRARATACALLSGGNIDATLLIQVMRHGLTHGRPVPRRPHADPRPPGRADQAACSSSRRSA